MESDSSLRRLRDVPFYRAPERVRTSGEIVQEARLSLNSQHIGPLPLRTRRPETPLEENRRLFRNNSAQDLTQRPPSTFSLGSRHFDPESRPSSGSIRLTPLPTEPKIRSPPSDVDIKVVPRPPPDPNRLIRRTNSRPRVFQPLLGPDGAAYSELALSRRRSESLRDVSDLWPMSSSSSSPNVVENPDDTSRRVRSGPKERTQTTAAEDKTNVEPIQSQGKPATTKSIRNDVKLKSALAVDEIHGRDDATTAAESQRNSRTGKADESKGRQQKTSERGEVGATASSANSRHGAPEKPDRGSAEGKRTGSAGTRKGSVDVRGGGASAGLQELAPDDDDGAGSDEYYERNIAPVLEEMTTAAHGRNVEKLSELSSRLYELLKTGQLLGKSCRQRGSILKSIFQLLDLDSPQLLLSLARLILALKVSGKNLLNVCKLIFAVSKDSRNDNLFLQDNILELLVETGRCVGVDHLKSWSDAHQTLVYCLGSLKFLSSNTSLVKLLATKSHLDSFAQILISVNESSRVSGITSDHTDILVQLTATLRNLANVSGNKQYFLSFGLVDEICNIMSTSTNDQELMYNISGLLSKLTLHTNCCESVAKKPVNFKSFLELLRKFKNREDLVLRVTFILGNLLARQDSARNFLFGQRNALETLLDVFRFYCEKDATRVEEKPESNGEVAAKAQKKFEDVIVKTVRVIANASISPDIGETIARSDECIELLLHVLEQKNLDSSEELVLNVMATINNLSFYSLRDSAIVKKRMRIARALLNFLEVKHKEGLAEATRVFGNLTREKDIRDFLVQNKIDEAMVAMLDSGDRELVFAACGVLINLMADEDKRSLLSREGGITKLIGVLQEFGRTDWQLAGMVCQTLWNFSAKITSTASCFGEEEAQELVDILIDYLDDDVVAEVGELDEEMRDYFYDMWETEFCPMASDLLRRIKEHQSHMEPILSRKTLHSFTSFSAANRISLNRWK